MSDIDFLVDRLEQLIQDSPHVPLTSKLLVDEEAILRLLDQLRASVPAQVREAQRVIQERDNLIVQGEEKAANIVKLAQEQADQMVSEAAVLLRAEQERMGILEKAEAEATRLRQAAKTDAERTRAEADTYALDVLRDLERSLASYQRTIANGIALLKRSGDSDKAS